MTAPDGRAWLTSAAIADRIISALEAAEIVAPEAGTDARAVAEDAYRATGYDLEFKILRLTERLRMQIEDGEIATVDEIRTAFRDIYTLEVLEQFDEEGRLIEETTEEGGEA